MNDLILKIDKFLNEEESEEISDEQYEDVVSNCLEFYKKLKQKSENASDSKKIEENIKLCEQLLEYFENNKMFTPKYRKLISLMYTQVNKFLDNVKKNNANESTEYELDEKITK